MAFMDQVALMYDDSIRITYLDKPHSYYAQQRIDYSLPATDPKAWGSKSRPKGTTTLLADTLEKKGIAIWMAGLPLKELFGFYDQFEGSNGQMIPAGFKRGAGTLWEPMLNGLTQTEALPLVLSASRAWQRRQKTGSDIGSFVHAAIEQYVLGKEPFDLTMDNYEFGQGDIKPDAEWYANAPQELAMAQLAYGRFVGWWEETRPKLLSAEQIVYSRKMDVVGTYDALLQIDGRIIVEDHKTSNASISGGAPEGVYYSYYLQSAIYALCLLEMGVVDRVDDLMVVSCRKDGNFNAVMASEVGLSMPEALEWAKSVIFCYRIMEKTKKQLIVHGTHA